ncbi:unnamed protein product [Danaus chrysippus]|uniref:(African queen) hypothetical protein n=1 Tax=Danaus chrysippus TaxID=151541 RepID=A0A8J2MIT3_9NEOP|nr:unnamed protein product [Danaus chrysippus]
MAAEDSLVGHKSLEVTSSSHNPTHGKSKKDITDYFLPRNKDTKEMVSRAIQVSLGACMSEDMCFDLPSEKYWNLLAEKKRIELEDALQENERLHKIRESLLEKNVHYRQMLEEANTFIDVFKEVVQDTADDTGIDIGDINDSTEN